MGGGDLNLKKSWHPLTMKNLERVWKAEQRHDAEQKRIQELQAEIKEERARDEVQQMAVDAGVIKPREDRVDWLYKGPGTINREEYLLGKPIDKAIDPTLIEEQREKEALSNEAGALFVSSSSVTTTADLEVKIREDPLFLIKKNEEEAKKRLLDNPLKLQQLQKIILKSKDKKKRKYKSEKKSKKKHRHHHDDSSHSESESDSKQRYTNRETRHHRDISPDMHQERHKHKRIDSRDRSPDNPRDRERQRYRRNDRHRNNSPDTSRQRYRDRSPVDRRTHSSRHHESSRGIDQSYRTEGSRDIKSSGGSSITRKMDPQELERKRRAMMSSAKERDIERELRVKRHKEELKKEESEVTTMKGKEGFLKPMRVESLTSSVSLKDRIHRNINSVQRTRTALDDNFLKR